MIQFNNPNDALIEELLAKSPTQDRCPHLQVDNTSLYCANNLTGQISKKRRLVCDTYSIQLGCLDKERFCKCLFYENPEELE